MSLTTTNASYLRGLNPEQRSAVLRTEGPLLILAGAGSGKTKTLVHRVVHLIRGRGVDPAAIAVVTFTNRAADEMRERVRSFAGDDARAVTVSTFHSLGLRLLRDHGKRLGLPSRFAIYGAADQLAALRTATAEISIGDDAYDLRRVLRRISEWKGRRVTPAEAAREVKSGRARGGAGGYNRWDEYDVLAADAYARYEEVLRASGAVDFDDLLLLPVRLLEEDEEVRRAAWRRWQYLMIDEYQDTNGVQLQLARLLAGQRRNLCVVGDDDQSIYAFRGADVGNILEFERHFPGAAVVKLEQNYRSTRRILAAANAVIAGNPRRHAKQLRTENAIGAPIDYREHDDEHAEAEVVAKEIQIRRHVHGLRWGDFAVLYRANTQSRPLEEAFRAAGVPYRVIGGTSFFDRKEVADAIAYLRAAANPSDEIAIRRIINYPPRGIGRTTVLRVSELAQQRAIPFARALADASAGDVGAAQDRAIHDFLALLHDARGALAQAEREAAAAPPPNAGLPPLARWADRLFKRVRLAEAIRADPRIAKSADARADNIVDLVGAIARYERKVWGEATGTFTGTSTSTATETGAFTPPPGWAPPTAAEALARVALAADDDRDDEREDDATVALMTLHSAKGLEFSDVFIVGLEEEILPHARSIEAAEGGESDALAEERRLFYVGITRARQRLTLSLCRARRKGGAMVERLPSRYLAEIPADLLDVKKGETILTEEQSAELRRGFFDQMRRMLAQGDEAG